MSRIILNAATLVQLQNLVEPVELCDQAGRLVGRFFPISANEELDLTPEISEEELQRRYQSNQKRYTTAEVLTHLEKL